MRENITWLHDNRTIIIGMEANKQNYEDKWMKYYYIRAQAQRIKFYAIVTDFERLCGKSYYGELRIRSVENV